MNNLGITPTVNGSNNQKRHIATNDALHIGSVQLPLKSVTKTFAILAKRGAGKSYTGAVMAEEFFKNGIPLSS